MERFSRSKAEVVHIFGNVKRWEEGFVQSSKWIMAFYTHFNTKIPQNVLEQIFKLHLIW